MPSVKVRLEEESNFKGSQVLSVCEEHCMFLKVYKRVGIRVRVSV